MLLQRVRLLTKLIYIVEESYILLFCFDEGCYNFIDTRNTGGFHYRLKRFLYDLRIPHILLQQSPLFSILVRQICDSNPQYLNWICEVLLGLAWSFRVFHRLIETLFVILESLVLFL